MTYKEYLIEFKSTPIKLLRAILKKLENDGENDFEDSEEHGAVIRYFNKMAFHKKVDKKRFSEWNKHE